MDTPDWFTSRHGKDIVQRLLVQVFTQAAASWYGLPGAPIIAALPTHLPQVQVRESIVDAVFQTADHRLLHFEFQSTREPALHRFLLYAAQLVSAYHLPVEVVVVYLTPVAHPPTELDGGALHLRVHNVIVPARDGTAVWADVVQHSTTAAPWTPTDLLNLAYGPFMSHPTLSTSQRARQAAELALTLPPPHSLAAVAMVVGLTASFLTPEDVNYVKEVLRMSPLLRELEQEALIKGRKEGRQEGRQEGRREGRQEGRREGRQEERTAFLMRLLHQRFGRVPASVEAAVGALPTDAAGEAVAVQVALAPSMEEVRALLHLR